MAKNSVALFFMYRQFGGGTTAFTVHLYEGFKRAGFDVKIYRVKERGEHFERKFAQYEGVSYRNINPDEAIKIVRHTPSLMTAPCNSKYLPFAPDIIGRLMKAGMRIVIHDPNEFEIYDHLKNRDKMQNPFCIRPTMQTFFPKAIWIKHPYVREYDRTEYVREQRELLAVSVARVTFVKRTEIIMATNRLLSKEDKIVLRGAENRLYTKWKLIPMFPEYRQGRVGFPMTWGASARECARAMFAVDFTWFPNDGGGSQYSFMEAWDAGAVNIIHSDWMRYPKKAEMRHFENCHLVENAEQCAIVVQSGRKTRGDWPELRQRIVNNGYKALRAHDPVKVAREYYEEMTR